MDNFNPQLAPHHSNSASLTDDFSIISYETIPISNTITNPTRNYARTVTFVDPPSRFTLQQLVEFFSHFGPIETMRWFNENGIEKYSGGLCTYQAHTAASKNITKLTRFGESRISCSLEIEFYSISDALGLLEFQQSWKDENVVRFIQNPWFLKGISPSSKIWYNDVYYSVLAALDERSARSDVFFDDFVDIFVNNAHIDRKWHPNNRPTDNSDISTDNSTTFVSTVHQHPSNFTLSNVSNEPSLKTPHQSQTVVINSSSTASTNSLFDIANKVKSSQEQRQLGESPPHPQDNTSSSPNLHAAKHTHHYTIPLNLDGHLFPQHISRLFTILNQHKAPLAVSQYRQSTPPSTNSLTSTTTPPTTANMHVSHNPFSTANLITSLPPQSTHTVSAKPRNLQQTITHLPQNTYNPNSTSVTAFTHSLNCLFGADCWSIQPVSEQFFPTVQSNRETYSNVISSINNTHACPIDNVFTPMNTVEAEHALPTNLTMNHSNLTCNDHRDVSSTIPSLALPTTLPFQTTPIRTSNYNNGKHQQAQLKQDSTTSPTIPIAHFLSFLNICIWCAAPNTHCRCPQNQFSQKYLTEREELTNEQKVVYESRQQAWFKSTKNTNTDTTAMTNMARNPNAQHDQSGLQGEIGPTMNTNTMNDLDADELDSHDETAADDNNLESYNPLYASLAPVRSDPALSKYQAHINFQCVELFKDVFATPFSQNVFGIQPQNVDNASNYQNQAMSTQLSLPATNTITSTSTSLLNPNPNQVLTPFNTISSLFNFALPSLHVDFSSSGSSTVVSTAYPLHQSSILTDVVHAMRNLPEIEHQSVIDLNLVNKRPLSLQVPIYQLSTHQTPPLSQSSPQALQSSTQFPISQPSSTMLPTIVSSHLFLSHLLTPATFVKLSTIAQEQSDSDPEPCSSTITPLDVDHDTNNKDYAAPTTPPSTVIEVTPIDTAAITANIDDLTSEPKTLAEILLSRAGIRSAGSYSPPSFLPAHIETLQRAKQAALAHFDESTSVPGDTSGFGEQKLLCDNNTNNSTDETAGNKNESENKASIAVFQLNSSDIDEIELFRLNSTNFRHNQAQMAATEPNRITSPSSLFFAPHQATSSFKTPVATRQPHRQQLLHLTRPQKEKNKSNQSFGSVSHSSMTSAVAPHLPTHPTTTTAPASSPKSCNRVDSANPSNSSTSLISPSTSITVTESAIKSTISSNLRRYFSHRHLSQNSQSQQQQQQQQHSEHQQQLLQSQSPQADETTVGTTMSQQHVLLTSPSITMGSSSSFDLMDPFAVANDTPTTSAINGENSSELAVSNMTPNTPRARHINTNNPNSSLTGDHRLTKAEKRELHHQSVLQFIRAQNSEKSTNCDRAVNHTGDSDDSIDDFDFTTMVQYQEYKSQLALEEMDHIHSRSQIQLAESDSEDATDRLFYSQIAINNDDNEYPADDFDDGDLGDEILRECTQRAVLGDPYSNHTGTEEQRGNDEVGEAIEVGEIVEVDEALLIQDPFRVDHVGEFMDQANTMNDLDANDGQNGDNQVNCTTSEINNDDECVQPSVDHQASNVNTATLDVEADQNVVNIASPANPPLSPSHQFLTTISLVSIHVSARSQLLHDANSYTNNNQPINLNNQTTLDNEHNNDQLQHPSFTQLHTTLTPTHPVLPFLPLYAALPPVPLPPSLIQQPSPAPLPPTSYTQNTHLTHNPRNNNASKNNNINPANAPPPPPISPLRPLPLHLLQHAILDTIAATPFSHMQFRRGRWTLLNLLLPKQQPSLLFAGHSAPFSTFSTFSSKSTQGTSENAKYLHESLKVSPILSSLSTASPNGGNLFTQPIGLSMPLQHLLFHTNWDILMLYTKNYQNGLDSGQLGYFGPSNSPPSSNSPFRSPIHASTPSIQSFPSASTNVVQSRDESPSPARTGLQTVPTTTTIQSNSQKGQLQSQTQMAAHHTTTTSNCNPHSPCVLSHFNTTPPLPVPIPFPTKLSPIQVQMLLDTFLTTTAFNLLKIADTHAFAARNPPPSHQSPVQQQQTSCLHELTTPSDKTVNNNNTIAPPHSVENPPLPLPLPHSTLHPPSPLPNNQPTSYHHFNRHELATLITRSLSKYYTLLSTLHLWFTEQTSHTQNLTLISEDQFAQIANEPKKQLYRATHKPAIVSNENSLCEFDFTPYIPQIAQIITLLLPLQATLSSMTDIFTLKPFRFENAPYKPYNSDNPNEPVTHHLFTQAGPGNRKNVGFGAQNQHNAARLQNPHQIPSPSNPNVVTYKNAPKPLMKCIQDLTGWTDSELAAENRKYFELDVFKSRLNSNAFRQFPRPQLIYAASGLAFTKLSLTSLQILFSLLIFIDHYASVRNPSLSTSPTQSTAASPTSTESNTPASFIILLLTKFVNFLRLSLYQFQSITVSLPHQSSIKQTPLVTLPRLFTPSYPSFFALDKAFLHSFQPYAPTSSNFFALSSITATSNSKVPPFVLTQRKTHNLPVMTVQAPQSFQELSFWDRTGHAATFSHHDAPILQNNDKNLHESEFPLKMIKRPRLVVESQSIDGDLEVDIDAGGVEPIAERQQLDSGFECFLKDVGNDGDIRYDQDNDGDMMLREVFDKDNLNDIDFDGAEGENHKIETLFDSGATMSPATDSDLDQNNTPHIAQDGPVSKNKRPRAGILGNSDDIENVVLNTSLMFHNTPHDTSQKTIDIETDDNTNNTDMSDTLQNNAQGTSTDDNSHIFSLPIWSNETFLHNFSSAIADRVVHQLGTSPNSSLSNSFHQLPSTLTSSPLAALQRAYHPTSATDLSLDVFEQDFNPTDFSHTDNSSKHILTNPIHPSITLSQSALMSSVSAEDQQGIIDKLHKDKYGVEWFLHEQRQELLEQHGSLPGVACSIDFSASANSASETANQSNRGKICQKPSSWTPLPSADNGWMKSRFFFTDLAPQLISPLTKNTLLASPPQFLFDGMIADTVAVDGLETADQCEQHKETAQSRNAYAQSTHDFDVKNPNTFSDINSGELAHSSFNPQTPSKTKTPLLNPHSTFTSFISPSSYTPAFTSDLTHYDMHLDKTSTSLATYTTKLSYPSASQPILMPPSSSSSNTKYKPVPARFWQLIPAASAPITPSNTANTANDPKSVKTQQFASYNLNNPEYSRAYFPHPSTLPNQPANLNSGEILSYYSQFSPYAYCIPPAQSESNRRKLNLTTLSSAQYFSKFPLLPYILQHPAILFQTFAPTTTTAAYFSQQLAPIYRAPLDDQPLAPNNPNNKIVFSHPFRHLTHLEHLIKPSQGLSFSDFHFIHRYSPFSNSVTQHPLLAQKSNSVQLHTAFLESCKPVNRTLERAQLGYHFPTRFVSYGPILLQHPFIYQVSIKIQLDTAFWRYFINKPPAMYDVVFHPDCGCPIRGTSCLHECNQPSNLSNSHSSLPQLSLTTDQVPNTITMNDHDNNNNISSTPTARPELFSPQFTWCPPSCQRKRANNQKEIRDFVKIHGDITPSATKAPMSYDQFKLLKAQLDYERTLKFGLEASQQPRRPKTYTCHHPPASVVPPEYLINCHQQCQKCIDMVENKFLYNSQRTMDMTVESNRSRVNMNTGNVGPFPRPLPRHNDNPYSPHNLNSHSNQQHVHHLHHRSLHESSIPLPSSKQNAAEFLIGFSNESTGVLRETMSLQPHSTIKPVVNYTFYGTSSILYLPFNTMATYILANNIVINTSYVFQTLLHHHLFAALSALSQRYLSPLYIGLSMFRYLAFTRRQKEQDRGTLVNRTPTPDDHDQSIPTVPFPNPEHSISPYLSNLLDNLTMQQVDGLEIVLTTVLEKIKSHFVISMTAMQRKIALFNSRSAFSTSAAGQYEYSKRALYDKFPNSNGGIAPFTAVNAADSTIPDPLSKTQSDMITTFLNSQLINLTPPPPQTIYHSLFNTGDAIICCIAPPSLRVHTDTSSVQEVTNANRTSQHHRTKPTPSSTSTTTAGGDPTNNTGFQPIEFNDRFQQAMVLDAGTAQINSEVRALINADPNAAPSSGFPKNHTVNTKPWSNKIKAGVDKASTKAAPPPTTAPLPYTPIQTHYHNLIDLGYLQLYTDWMKTVVELYFQLQDQFFDIFRIIPTKPLSPHLKVTNELVNAVLSPTFQSNTRGEVQNTTNSAELAFDPHHGSTIYSLELLFGIYNSTMFRTPPSQPQTDPTSSHTSVQQKIHFDQIQFETPRSQIDSIPTTWSMFLHVITQQTPSLAQQAQICTKLNLPTSQDLTTMVQNARSAARARTTTQKPQTEHNAVGAGTGTGTGTGTARQVDSLNEFARFPIRVTRQPQPTTSRTSHSPNQPTTNTNSTNYNHKQSQQQPQTQLTKPPTTTTTTTATSMPQVTKKPLSMVAVPDYHSFTMDQVYATLRNIRRFGIETSKKNAMKQIGIWKCRVQCPHGGVELISPGAGTCNLSPSNAPSDLSPSTPHQPREFLYSRPILLPLVEQPSFEICDPSLHFK